MPSERPTEPTSLPVVDERMDAASQSLADALRLTFRILKVAMVLIVISFLCSGFFTVDQNQVGLVMRFGSIAESTDGSAVRAPGFQIALPDPLDRKVLLPTDQQTLVVDTFAAAGAGNVHTGLDGYMITADQNLIHAVWTVQYRIDDPVTFVRNVVDAETFAESGAESLIRAAVEDAVVRTAARYSATDILFVQFESFRGDIRTQVRESMIPYGIEIVDVGTRGQPSVPQRVQGALSIRTAAGQGADQEIKRAEGERITTLTNAVGEEYPALVEQLDAYEIARRKNDGDNAAQLEASIHDFMQTRATGETATLINSAVANKTNIEERAKSDLRRFQDLLPGFLAAPETVLATLANNVKTELLKNAKGQTYFPAGTDREIVIDAPLEWQRQAETEAYRQQTEGRP